LLKADDIPAKKKLEKIETEGKKENLPPSSREGYQKGRKP